MLLPLLLLACTTTKAGEVRESYADQGFACRDGDGLVIDFDSCVAQQCEELANDTCTAVLDGDTLTVSGSVDIVSTGDNSCDDICGTVYARCDLPEGVTDDTVVSYAGTETTWAELPECTLI